MMLGLGTLEVFAFVVVMLLARLAYVCGFSTLRWSVAIGCCAAVGAIVTPADIFSMLVMTTILIGFYYAGSRHSREAFCG